MNEKRFYKYFHDKKLVWTIKDLKDKKTIIFLENKKGNCEEIINLLNELVTECNQLKARNKFLEEFDGRTETFANLKEENEQLQAKLDFHLSLAETKIKNREKENEQLRQTIKEMQNDERLYANEIVQLNKEAKEVLNFKTLGGDY